MILRITLTWTVAVAVVCAVFLSAKRREVAERRCF